MCTQCTCTCKYHICILLSHCKSLLCSMFNKQTCSRFTWLFVRLFVRHNAQNIFENLTLLYFWKAQGPRTSKLIFPTVKYTNTQTQVQKYNHIKYKKEMQIQVQKYEYINTNSQIQIHKYKRFITGSSPTYVCLARFQQKISNIQWSDPTRVR